MTCDALFHLNDFLLLPFSVTFLAGRTCKVMNVAPRHLCPKGNTCSLWMTWHEAVHGAKRGLMPESEGRASDSTLQLKEVEVNHMKVLSMTGGRIEGKKPQYFSG